MKQISIRVSEHAFRRARKRLGWPKRAINRMAYRVWTFGTHIGAFSAAVMQSVCRDDHQFALRRFVLYGQHLFVFAVDERRNPVLCTVYRPSRAYLKNLIHLAKSSGSHVDPRRN